MKRGQEMGSVNVFTNTILEDDTTKTQVAEERSYDAKFLNILEWFSKKCLPGIGAGFVIFYWIFGLIVTN